MKNEIITFNKIIEKLNSFWKKKTCIIIQPVDQEVGAATFHPMTFINALTHQNFNAAYTQISRRPTDIRYTKFSNRSILFHQYQVIMKPSPLNIQELYMRSLEEIGIKIKKNEINFIEDNWKSPSLGANGIGWEVRLNGTEITQFTYFQQMGDLECSPIMVEIAYGLERLALHLQKIQNIEDIIFDSYKNKNIKYSEIFLKYEKEMNIYIKEEIDPIDLKRSFLNIEKECKKLIDKNLPRISYEKLIKLSHLFNLIDANKYIPITERFEYIEKMRFLSKKIAEKIKNEK